MKLYLSFTNSEATEPQQLVGGYVEIEFNKKEFLTLKEERLFAQYFVPAIWQLRQMIEEGETKT